MNRSAVITAALGLMMIQPLQAKTITGEQAARVTSLLESCVAAVTTGSNAAFDGWNLEKGFVPVGYLSYERWVPPEGDYKIVFAQRGDKPGRPFVCEAAREVGGEGSSDLASIDRNIIRWVNELPDMVLAGVRFERDDGFELPRNASVLSACISGQRLLLAAGVAFKGAVKFGVGIPNREVLKC